jgi:threonylcarbamoyladenosine tRNA methylthiotransferase MtaB
MPQVPSPVRKQRAALLRAEGEKQMQKYLASQIGRELEIVVEQDGMSGHSEGFAPVRLAAEAPVGSIQRVTIARADDRQLYAA